MSPRRLLHIMIIDRAGLNVAGILHTSAVHNWSDNSPRNSGCLDRLQRRSKYASQKVLKSGGKIKTFAKGYVGTQCGVTEVLEVILGNILSNIYIVMLKNTLHTLILTFIFHSAVKFKTLELQTCEKVGTMFTIKKIHKRN